MILTIHQWHVPDCLICQWHLGLLGQSRLLGILHHLGNSNLINPVLSGFYPVLISGNLLHPDTQLLRHLLGKLPDMSFLIPKSHHIFFQKMQFRNGKNPHTDNAVCRSERVKEALKEVNDIPRTTTISYSSTTPWNSTGFYYSPRYPQSHRGIYKYRILAGKFKCFFF